MASIRPMPRTSTIAECFACELVELLAEVIADFGYMIEQMVALDGCR